MFTVLSFYQIAILSFPNLRRYNKIQPTLLSFLNGFPCASNGCMAHSNTMKSVSSLSCKEELIRRIDNRYLLFSRAEPK